MKRKNWILYGRSPRALAAYSLNIEGEGDGGGDSGAGGGNNGGNGGGDGGNNGGDGGTGTPPKDNKDNGVDLTQFWNTEPPKAGEGGNDGEPKPLDLGAIYTQATSTVKPALTQDMFAAAAEGNMEPINKSIQETVLSAVKASMQVMIPVLRQFETEMEARNLKNVDGKLTQTSQDSALAAAIPQVKDPTAGPMIRNIYSQALKNTKGNTDEAIKQTKEMMRITSIGMGGAVDLTLAPSDPNSRGGGGETNWLESLMVAK